MSESATAGGVETAPRRRRWVWVLAGLLIVVVLLAVLAPTLLSTPAGKNFILGKVNAKIAGRAEADSISLGWFSGAKVYGLKLKDPAGAVVLEAPSVTTGLTVLGALGSVYDLGDVMAEVAAVRLETAGDGTTNLARALAPPAGAASPADGASPAKGKTGSTGAGTIARGNAALHVTLLTWRAPGAETLTVTSTAATAKFDTGGAPLDFQLSTFVAAGERAPSNIKMGGKLSVFESGGVKPVEQITGTASAEVAKADLAALSPLLAKYGVTLERGTIAGSIKYDAPAPGSATLAGRFDAADTAVGGAALKGDRLSLKSVAIPVNVTLRGRVLEVAQLGVESDLLSLAAKGSITMDAVDALLRPASAATPADSSLTFTGSAKLAEFVRQAPRLANLQQGVTVDSGTAALDGFVTARGGVVTSELVATLPDVTGTRDGRRITLEPLRLAAAAAAENKQLRPTASLLMPAAREGAPAGTGGQTLSLTLTPNPADLDDLTIAARYDLTRLESQLAQFVDLGGKRFGGTGDATVKAKRREDKAGTALAFDATANTKGLVLVGFFAQEIREPQLVAKARGSALISADPKAPHTASFDELDVAGVTIVFRTNKKPAKIAYTGQTGALAAEFEEYAAMLDVAAWSPIIVPLAKLPEGTQLKGGLNSSGKLRYDAGGVVYSGNTMVASFQNLAPAAKDGRRPEPLPPTNLSVGAHGKVDLAQRTFTADADCVLKEQDPLKPSGNLVFIKKGSRVSWAAPATATAPRGVDVATFDVHGVAHYELDRLTKLLGSLLPEGIDAKGNRDVSFHLTGAMTDEEGLKKFRNLTLDEKVATRLGWDALTMPTYGVALGAADIGVTMKEGVLTIARTAIPANGGTLTIGGALDMKAGEPALMIARGSEPLPLLRGIRINKEFAAGPLAAFPLAWGAGDSGKGLVEVSGTAHLDVAEAYLPLDFATLKQRGTLEGTMSIDKLTTDAPLYGQLGSVLGGAGSLGGLGSLGKMLPGDVGIRDVDVRDVRFSMRQGKVHYENFTLPAPAMTLTFSGDVGMNFDDPKGAPLMMGVAVKHKNFPAPVTVFLAGTTKNPTPRIDEKTIQKSIEQTAPNLIEGLLKKQLEKKK